MKPFGRGLLYMTRSERIDAIDYKWVDIHQSPENPYLKGCDDFIAF